MTTDEFELFRGLPISREQDAEIRAYIARFPAPFGAVYESHIRTALSFET